MGKHNEAERFSHILQARANRNSRAFPAVNTLSETFLLCEKASNAILKGQIDHEYLPLVERSVVISLVTSFEVYFRDVLFAILKYCDRAFVEPKMKLIHADKYDISELIELIKLGIEPHELVVRDLAFQNRAQIERVFSNFVQGGFWSSILKSQVEIRQKGSETSTGVFDWTPDDLASLDELFNLRHELVHDPMRGRFFNSDVHSTCKSASVLMLGAHFLLEKVMRENMSAMEFKN